MGLHAWACSRNCFALPHERVWYFFAGVAEAGCSVFCRKYSKHSARILHRLAAVFQCPAQPVSNICSHSTTPAVALWLVALFTTYLPPVYTTVIKSLLSTMRVIWLPFCVTTQAKSTLLCLKSYILEKKAGLLKFTNSQAKDSHRPGCLWLGC
jgi:hypothetical protein